MTQHTEQEIKPCEFLSGACIHCEATEQGDCEGYVCNDSLYASYTHRPWQGLEIEEVQDSYNSDYQAQTRAVEAKLRSAMDTEYTEKTYGVDRFLLEGWFSIEEIEKLLVEMKGRVITPSLPVQRPWVGLDEDDIRKLYGKDLNYRDGNYVRYAKRVEAELKERNGY